MHVETLGEHALLLRVGDGIDVDTNRRVHTLAAAIQAQRPPWLRELVPAYACLVLEIDPDALPGEDALAQARSWLEATRFDAAPDEQATSAPTLQIPVRYGGDQGPDLADVAMHAGLSLDDTVARHAQGDYQVAMLGFAPGFPYLLGLDPALAMPRLATPRRRVEAGSVGIGGAQTGIYPNGGPGGWRIIGRTPLPLFDAVRDPPSLLLPGQRVRFIAVDAAEFDRIAGATRRRARFA